MKVYELLNENTKEKLLSAPSHEIATFIPSKTKLQSSVWICEIEGYSRPLLKVSNSPTEINLKDNFLVSISKKPRLLTPSTKSNRIELKPITNWIIANYEALMDFWRAHMTGNGDTVSLYKKIKSASQLNEMANFYPKDTGIPYSIWIGKAEKHPSSRIKVSNIAGKFAQNDNFVVKISKEPNREEDVEGDIKIPTKVVKSIFEWVKINYEVLMKIADYFDKQEGDIEELIPQLKSVKSQKDIKPKE